jgi:cytochrome c biogenesis protein CcdA
MRKELKSLLIILTIFGLYVYATIGVLKILNLIERKKDFIKYVSSIMVFIFLFSLIYIIGIGKLFNSHEIIMSLYGVYIVINLFFLVLGNILNYFLKFNLSKE